MEVLKTTSPVTSTGAPKLFPRKMVPSSRASTAALPSSTIVVSKVAHIRKGPFQAFSLFRVFGNQTCADGKLSVWRRVSNRMAGLTTKSYIWSHRCLNEKFAESHAKRKRFFEENLTVQTGGAESPFEWCLTQGLLRGLLQRFRIPDNTCTAQRGPCVRRRLRLSRALPARVLWAWNPCWVESLRTSSLRSRNPFSEVSSV